jgi:HEAT repeat protein
MAKLSRPACAEELIERLQSSSISEKEKQALTALSDCMIDIFRDKPYLSYVKEAASLAPITSQSTYTSLCRAFNHAIIKGTADGSSLEPLILDRYTYVIRKCDGKTADLDLGSVVQSLQHRLEKAMQQASLQSQYQLLLALSPALDAMIDRKTTGLSRESLHEPLLNQLEKLMDNKELRLAQIAKYAREALRGITNDESPYRALLRNTVIVINATAKIAGAVTTMDPSKLFDGIVSLAELPDLISAMVDVVRELSSGFSDLRKIRGISKQKSWYIALRFTDMLIQSNAFNHLDKFLEKVPCRNEEDFLCGLYAQLELSWIRGFNQDAIVRFCEHTVNPAASMSKYQRVQKWMVVMGMTVRRDWILGSLSKSTFKLPWRTSEFHTNVTFNNLDDEPLRTDLLETAWRCCSKAQIYYADAILRGYYLQGDHLKVERLSGAALPMAQCYINLAVIERSNSEDKADDEDHLGPKSSPFSLFTRLKVETPEGNLKVDLPTLFKPRNIRQKGVTEPQRILIRGQAGVGKTTLCKKLVHDYIKEDMWQDHFARVIWVPLRSFKSKSTSTTDDLDAWIKSKYFPSPTRDGDILGKTIIHAVNDPTKYGKTLFILDGLDEVSRELGSGASSVLDTLLRQTNVIVTSRPSISFNFLDNLDLEIETVGFYPDQVQAYVRSVAPKYASEIEHFIQSRWIIQGLVRIPIQLEALCFSWDAGAAKTSTVPRTMTELYQSIFAKLWRKDAARLDKPYDGVVLTDKLARPLLGDEIEELVSPEATFIQALAFTGLFNEILEFDPGFIGDLRNQLRKDMSPADELPPSQSLGKLSFLRTSDSSIDEQYRTYHFLHLTIQEFYAARYFVNHWPAKDMQIYSLDHGKIVTETLSCQDFIKRQKYNPRYEVMWRFVAGLLHSPHNESNVCLFFDLVEGEPRDLLGSVHQRLVIHCLGEVPEGTGPSSFATRRESLQSTSQEWLLFECSLASQSSLATEMEFPSSILQKLLHSQNRQDVRAVLKSLAKRPRVSGVITSMIAGFLRDHDRVVRSAAAEALTQKQDLPVTVFDNLVGLLRDPESLVRLAATRALGNRPNLSTTVLNSLTDLLGDPDYDVRQAAAGVLGNQRDLSITMLKRLTYILRNSNFNYRNAAANALGQQRDLPLIILDMLTDLIPDLDYGTRSTGASVLRDQAILPTRVIDRLTNLLRDPISSTRSAAAEALRIRSDLPATVLDILAGLLRDPVDDVRSSAARTLGFQQNLSPTLLGNLTDLFQDSEYGIRHAAAYAVGDQRNLPAIVIISLTDLLRDPHDSVRWTAARALGNQPNLPLTVLDSMTVLLRDPDYFVQWATAEALRKQPALPVTVLDGLVDLLQHYKSIVHTTATRALGEQSDLPAKIVDTLTILLRDPDSDNRSRAAQILENHFWLHTASLLYELEEESFNSMFEYFLKQSINNHVVWYIEEGQLCIVSGERRRTVPHEGLAHKLSTAREYVNCPIKIPN